MPDITTIQIIDGQIVIGDSDTGAGISNALETNSYNTTVQNSLTPSSSDNIVNVDGVNLGMGIGIYSGASISSTGTEFMTFKSLVPGAGISINSDDNCIYISSNALTPGLISYFSLAEVSATSIVPNGIQYAAPNGKLTFVVPPTSYGQVLTYNGTSINWASLPSTSVSFTGGTGINVTGSPVTGNGAVTIGLSASGVSSGSYIAPSLTVDSTGRIIDIASNTLSKLTAGQTLTTGHTIYAGISNDGTTMQFKALVDGFGITSVETASSITINLNQTGVTAGTYTAPVLTIDTYGRILSATNNTILAPLASPVFTGTPTAPTPSNSDNSTKLSTTAYVQNVLATYASTNSPNFSGTPTAPTASSGTNSTQIATTAFVNVEIAASASISSPLMNGVASAGSSSLLSRQDHIHPTDTSRAPLVSPAFSGLPTAPTPTVGDNSQSLATTAFIATAFTNSASSSTPLMNGSATPGSSSFFARGDHVHPIDTTRAPLASPGFSGVPTAPTANTGTNTMQIATTAFVNASLSTYATLASPSLSGTPLAPTASLGTNTTQIATTAFVASTLNNSLATVTPLMDGTASVGVSTFFARQDHVHPTNTSLAPLSSPAFTGTPTAPTASSGTNTTQIATTGFVTTATDTMVVAGSGSPSNGVGLNGQFYIDTVGRLIYGPKASGSWPGTGSSVGGVTYTAATTAPTSPTPYLGDLWYDTNTDVLYTRANDGNSSFWIDISSSTSITPANPIGLVGLTAVNGSASTYMRSDAAPRINQAIIPTWSGLHTFNAGTTINGGLTTDATTAVFGGEIRTSGLNTLGASLNTPNGITIYLNYNSNGPIILGHGGGLTTVQSGLAVNGGLTTDTTTASFGGTAQSTGGYGFVTSGTNAGLTIYDRSSSYSTHFSQFTRSGDTTIISDSVYGNVLTISSTGNITAYGQSLFLNNSNNGNTTLESYNPNAGSSAVAYVQAGSNGGVVNLRRASVAAGNYAILYSDGNPFYISSSGGPMVFQTGFPLITALTLDTSQNATFNGSVTALYHTTPGVTVASLVAAATAGQGARAFVTDATATTFLSTVAGGGTNKVPVVSDGTNWLIG